MKSIILLIAMTTLVASCASSSNTNNRIRNVQVSKNAKQTLANKDSKERVICRQHKKTGSHRVTTICLSESEMQASREKSKRELQRRNGPGESATQRISEHLVNGMADQIQL